MSTEGMRDHVRKANELKLPHAEYFNKLFKTHDEDKNESKTMQSLENVAEFLFCMLTKCPKEEFGKKEWSVNETTEWWTG